MLYAIAPFDVTVQIAAIVHARAYGGPVPIAKAGHVRILAMHDIEETVESV
jgi:hypothetical protein